MCALFCVFECNKESDRVLSQISVSSRLLTVILSYVSVNATTHQTGLKSVFGK